VVESESGTVAEADLAGEPEAAIVVDPVVESAPAVEAESAGEGEPVAEPEAFIVIEPVDEPAAEGESAGGGEVVEGAEAPAEVESIATSETGPQTPPTQPPVG
jgi:hypothetical protein